LVEPEERLRDFPWGAWESLQPLLQEPIAQVLQNHAAERVVDKFLRAHRAFSRDQRHLAKEIIFGVSIYRRRLFHFMGLQAPPASLLQAFRELPQHRIDDWRVRYSFPDWLADEFVANLGDEAEALARSLNFPGPKVLRVNRLLSTKEALQQLLLQHGIETAFTTLSPDGLVLTQPQSNFYGLPQELQAQFEVQDEGSQALSFQLGLKPGDSVFDVCAGAGGKSLHLKSLVGPRGTVHAFDVDGDRLERLRRRAHRAQSDVQIHHQWPESLRTSHVLVDAPCSELGALRRGPDARWRVEPDDLIQWPPLQLSILERAAKAVSPDGTLMYATCTFRHQENEEVVNEFLNRHPSFHLRCPFFKTFPHRLLHASASPILNSEQLVPSTPDAFFGAVLKRAGLPLRPEFSLGSCAESQPRVYCRKNAYTPMPTK
jgi:16S rRNA (cytosine967-C5)-methyltransferase